MDRTSELEGVLQRGTDVYGSDDSKVGSISAVRPDHIVVEKGFIFPTDYYIPMSAIASYSDDRVYLSVTKDEALHQEWGNPPTQTAGFETDDPQVKAGQSTAAGWSGVATPGTEAPVDGEAVIEPDRYEVGAERGEAVNAEHTSIPVHEEELVARKRSTDRGEVHIEKDVVSEDQVLEVPVTEERVRVQRRVVDREASPNEAAFDETSINVPVRGETVDVEKRVRVSEELEVDKEVVEHNEQVSGTVRREQVRVDDQTGSYTGDEERTQQ